MTADNFIQSLRDMYEDLVYLTNNDQEKQAKEILFNWLKRHVEDITYYGSYTLLDEALDYPEVNALLLDWFFLENDKVAHIIYDLP